MDSVLANDYPKDKLEVLVVDGMSDDGTRVIVEDYAASQWCVRLIDNPARITPVGLNKGIGAAKGSVIMRLDAHAKISSDYISECVKSLKTFSADNVGGNMKTRPRGPGLVASAIVCTLSHPFGVGNSHFRISSAEPKWVDTVFGGCYKREVFEKIGYFNEKLVRSQDIEFNLRLKQIGGRTLLLPHIVTWYYARSDMLGFAKNNFRNGVWAILPFAYSDVIPVSWRHLAPGAFIVSLIGTGTLGIFVAPLLWSWVVILGTYLAASLIAGLQIGWRYRDYRYVVVMPLVFGMLHFGYGFGSVFGLIRTAVSAEFWRKGLSAVRCNKVDDV